jgi:hypothetical protein
MAVKGQPENVEYFDYFGSLLTDDATCTREIKCRIATAEAAFSKKKTFHRQFGEGTSEMLHSKHSFVWC